MSLSFVLNNFIRKRNMAKSKDRIIDTAINEWRKQLKVRMREDGQYFEHLL